MSSKLYLECYSGISGDMMVAALLDLGANQDQLNKALHSLPVQGFQTKISRVCKVGLDACDFDVILDSKHENHDHDMKYLHGEEHQYEAEHAHSHLTEQEHLLAHESEHTHSQDHLQSQASEHTHAHEHLQAQASEHTHSHEPIQSQASEHIHAHEHRGLKEILNIIEQAEMSEKAKKIAAHIFEILAKAEAKAHGVEMEQVHFHEVGAVDSIVDVVAVAVCIDNLCITDVIVPVLYEGIGTIRCQHGIIPIPVPAVSHIVSDNGLHLHITETEGEFVTPTGAAIVAALKTSHKLPEQFTIQKIGIGAGKRNYERPSILRAMLIRSEA